MTLSEHGAHCILVSRKMEDLREVVAKIEENSAKAIAIACHMGYLNQKELADKNIRVNALLPGLTKTRFSRALVDNKEFYNNAIKHIPMGRYAEPEEMAGAVLYLLSDAASYTTGMCLACDGGLLA